MPESFDFKKHFRVALGTWNRPLYQQITRIHATLSVVTLCPIRFQTRSGSASWPLGLKP